MIIDKPGVFDEAARELLPHVTHKLRMLAPDQQAYLDVLAIECEDCRHIVLEFVRDPAHSEQPDPDHVRYEAHYDESLDLCYIEVFKPGKAPYPMQERQDLINHSPTGISWGYGGSGPAQCAFAILMDYFGDEKQARTLYQDFKFKVIAKFPSNSEWTLTGRQIDAAIARMTLKRT